MLNVKTLILLAGLIIFKSGPAFSLNNGDANFQNEDLDAKKLEKVLVDYNKDSKRVLDDTQKLSNDEKKDITDEELTREEIKELDSFASEIKKEQRKNIPLPDYKKEKLPSDLSKLKFSESVIYLLQPLQALPDHELRKIIVDKVSTSAYEPIFEFEPRLYDFCVRMVKDKTAISQFSKIVENRYKLLRMFYATLFTFFIAWVVKKAMYNKNRPLFSTLFYSSIRISFFMAVRLSVLWYFFSEELRPTVQIFSDVFFS